MVAQLSAIQGAGHQVIVVHGGGKQIKETLERLAIPSRFHHGLRVTDAPTMRVVQMVLSGWVNKEIVAAFQKLGHKAVGLCGGDGGSFVARKYQPQTNRLTMATLARFSKGIQSWLTCC
jgi:acetylglutamate kinase